MRQSLAFVRHVFGEDGMFAAEVVEVHFYAGGELSQLVFQAVFQERGRRGVEGFGAEPFLVAEPQSPFVVEFLRDYQHAVEAVHFAGLHYGAERARTVVVEDDALRVHAALGERVADGGRFVTTESFAGAVIAATGYECVYLGGSEKCRGGIDAVGKMRIPAPVGRHRRCGRQQRVAVMRRLGGVVVKPPGGICRHHEVTNRRQQHNDQQTYGNNRNHLSDHKRSFTLSKAARRPQRDQIIFEQRYT